MHRNSESPFALRLAGRKYPSSKPCGSVGGVDRLVKARPLGWPSASLDPPPATACLMPTACADQGTMNSPPSRCRHQKRLDKRVLIEAAGGEYPQTLSVYLTPISRSALGQHRRGVR